MGRKKKVKVEENSFVPSKYQVNIIDWVENGEGNAVIEAVAGSGKSTTALKCIEHIKEGCNVLLTAFNTAIAQDLKKKLKNADYKCNVVIKTTYSVGVSIFQSYYQYNKDEYKYDNYIRDNILSLSNGYYDTLEKKDKNRYVDNVKKLIKFGRLYICKTLEDIEQIEKDYSMTILNNEKEVALMAMEWGKEHLDSIDFTDMVWLPNELDLETPNDLMFDWIICDECQDLSKAERELILRCCNESTRMLFFGERFQCQPEGTKILMANGLTKDIKRIKVGDEVVSYNIRKTTYSGYKSKNSSNNCVVTGVEHHFEDKFIKITTENGLTSTYTPEHICLVKYNCLKYPKVWGVILMQNDFGMFFIGRAVLYSNRTFYGMDRRLKMNGCKRGWLLSIQFDESHALIEVERMRQTYSIPVAPSLLFGRELKNEILTKDFFDLYESIGHEKINENALKCLGDNHKLIDYPLTDLDVEIPNERTKLHVIRACNLVPEIMEVSYFDESQKSKRVKNTYRYAGTLIKNIEYIDERKKVYSITVSQNHTYVADGIATHNCIYSFKGSDHKSFEELLRIPNTKSLPLSISYRCPKKVVELAKKINPNIEAKEDAIEGGVEWNKKIEDIQDGDMVLCRTNAPLLQLYCDLSRLGKTAFIKGKDIGKNLIKRVKETNERMLYRNLRYGGVFSKLYDKLLDDIDLVMKKNKVTLEMAMEDPTIQQGYDEIQALEAISYGFIYTDELIDKLNVLFSDSTKEGITLSTIHKAKGLECNNIFICCESLLHATKGSKDWEIEQEKNLEYVAYTRAKGNLYFLDETNFNKYIVSSSELAKEVENIKKSVELLHGRTDRCRTKELSLDAAKRIIDSNNSSQRIGKIKDITDCKQQKSVIGFDKIIRKKKKK